MLKRAADPSSHAAGSLAWAEHLPTFIEIDLKNAFNSACRQAAFDALSGVATKDYVGAGVSSGETLPCQSGCFAEPFWILPQHA